MKDIEILKQSLNSNHLNEEEIKRLKELINLLNIDLERKQKTITKFIMRKSNKTIYKVLNENAKSYYINRGVLVGDIWEEKNKFMVLKNE